MASTPWERALVKFQSGDMDGALTILRRAMAQAEKDRGTDSADFAEACFHLAEMLSAFDDLAGAIEVMRRAAAAQMSGPPGRQDHLVYLLHLGELLRQNGDLAEAEQVQREGLAGRESLHGATHPGHAFGQLALAEVLVDAERLPEATALLEAALVTLWQEGHPGVARAIALRALCLKGVEGADVQCFQPLGPLPSEIFADTVQQVFQFVGRPGHAASTLALLQELEPWVLERQPGAQRDLQLALAEAARVAGDGLARIGALTELEALAPQPADRVEVLLELGSAYAEAERPEAEAAYARALAGAEQFDHPELVCTARRLSGRWLANQGRLSEAEPLLRSAVALARSEDLYEALGRSLISLGIFLQGDPDTARPLLQEGVARLMPGDEDLVDGEAVLAVIGGLLDPDALDTEEEADPTDAPG